MPLPSAIQLAVVTDLTLKALAAVIGTDHAILVASPIAESAVLLTAGIVLHEAGNMVREVARSVLRWWRRRR